ncbi:MAG TPA: class I SAM-dependent methyltransferase [Dehalococcoidia bacterium]|nr:class I SAM-dependent methyltransferase [Dehalococcoidia bacterium]
MRQSISFDRAASFYDRTRAMPPATVEAITNELLAQTKKAGADRLLEVGVGTGRISRPLLERGQHVVGVDISTEMMAQLLAQLTPAHLAPDLMLGDATRLPFCDDTFRAVLMVHVFHLVASVEKTIQEIRRVLAPGGVFLHKVQRDNAPFAANERWWNDALTGRGHPPISRMTFDHQREILAATGAQLESIDIVTDATEVDAEVIIEEIPMRLNSWSWQVDDAVFEELAPAYQRWFAETYPPVVIEKATHQLEVWRWPD